MLESKQEKKANRNETTSDLCKTVIEEDAVRKPHIATR